MPVHIDRPLFGVRVLADIVAVAVEVDIVVEGGNMVGQEADTEFVLELECTVFGVLEAASVVVEPGTGLACTALLVVEEPGLEHTEVVVQELEYTEEPAVV